MLDVENLHPVGIGTFRLDEGNVDHELAGLIHSFERGQNIMSTNMVYYGGEISQSVKRFIEQVPRDEMFYLVGVDVGMGDSRALDASLRGQVEDYLVKMGIECVDCVQVHDYANTNLIEVYEVLAGLQAQGKTRYLSASNVGPRQLAAIESVAKLALYEGMFNFECRQNEDEGVFSYCREHGIRVMGYQTLRRGLTEKRGYPALRDVSAKYGVTQSQIIISWLVNHRKVDPLIKSTDIRHIDQNVDAASLELDAADLAALDAFSAPELIGSVVDWDHTGIGTLINRVPYLMGDYQTAPRVLGL